MSDAINKQLITGFPQTDTKPRKQAIETGLENFWKPIFNFLEEEPIKKQAQKDFDKQVKEYSMLKEILISDKGNQLNINI